MRSTFHGLEAMKRALYTQQTALSTMSHNVANANTPGYSRQVVDMSAFHPLQYPAMSRGTEAGQLGQGSWVDSIRRMRDTFRDAQYRSENGSLGEWQINKQTLDQIDQIINEPSDTGIAKAVTEFFNAWEDLASSPNTITARKAVREAAITLVDTFHHVDNQLTTLTGDMKESIDKNVTEVNNTLDQIKELNRQIKLVQSTGDNPNDLLDRRDLLVDNLSKIVDVKVSDTSSGYSLDIGGQTVLQDDTYSPLAYNKVTGDITISSGTVTLGITSGEIKGLIDSQTNYVDLYRTQLNTFVGGLVNGQVTVTDSTGTAQTYNGINGIHRTGYSLHNPALTGIDFFTKPATDATFTLTNIQVNPQIIGDEKYISTANTRTPNDPTGVAVASDNDIALMIGQMVNQKMQFTGTNPIDGSAVTVTGTLEDYFQSLVGQLGIQSRQAERMEKNQDAITQQLDSSRESVKGVSLDEEMANMIKFQQSYNAAARVVTTIDSILDRIVNGMGLTR